MNKNYIDLGLPSGTLWAKCNIGAKSETDYGDYFMFGSTTPNTDTPCDWEHAPFNNGQSGFDKTYFNAHKSEWLDENGALKPEYDAAHVIMGSEWRMPTDADFNELLDGTTSEWVEDYQDSGVNGRLFTSKINGKTLFFPAAGYRYGSFFGYQGGFGYVWSSVLYTDCPYDAWKLFFLSDNYFMYLSFRCFGYPVRGVMNL